MTTKKILSRVNICIPIQWGPAFRDMFLVSAIPSYFRYIELLISRYKYDKHIRNTIFIFNIKVSDPRPSCSKRR